MGARRVIVSASIGRQKVLPPSLVLLLLPRRLMSSLQETNLVLALSVDVLPLGRLYY